MQNLYIKPVNIRFEAGGNHPRKRGRAAPTATTKTTAINKLCMQPQTQPQPLSTTQLIDLSQLHNHRVYHPQPNPNVVSTGLRLSFGDQQQQQNHQYQQQNFGTSTCQSSAFLSSSEDFSTQIKRQRDEIDQFLQAQVPKLSLLNCADLCFVFFYIVFLMVVHK